MGIRSKIWIALGLATGLLSGSGAMSPGAAYTESVLYTFCPSSGCSDGAGPGGPLLKSGNKLYGVAGGGANGKGVVFQFNTNNSNYKVLYSFCTTTFMGVCSDGESPAGRLIADTNGNLYGTTSLGGNTHNAGTVFELIKPSSGGVWTYQKIYNFCPTRIGAGLCPDGNDPLSGLTYAGAAGGTPYDGTSLLFGITFAGGSGAANSLQGTGVVFALQLSGTWSEKVLHAFCPTCSSGCTVCTDGTYAEGQIQMDASNRIWGTTIIGGSNNSGVAWELTPGANLWSDPWTEAVVYNFCWNGASKCADGLSPTGVLLDGSGNIFGTTQQGGNGLATAGNGIVFELAAGSSCTEGGTATFLCETVKHNFCHTTCADGSEPNGDLIMDGSANIFGTTFEGGSTASVSVGAGVVFKQNGTTNTTLYTFCSSAGACPDGAFPPAGVIMDASADLFGTAAGGGDTTNQAGVIYELTP